MPNKATNDQTPTYETAETLATLQSGERLSVAFGKIKLALTHLIDHLTNKNNPHAVTLSQLSETDVLKIMTATEREKLNGIADGATKYTHPSSHPASMITGLADAVSALGYGKVVCGTFTGTSNAAGSMSTSKTITLPFSASMVIFGTASVPFKDAYGTHFVVAQGASAFSGAKTLATLSGKTLTINSNGSSGTVLLSSDYTYFWIAIA